MLVGLPGAPRGAKRTEPVRAGVTPTLRSTNPGGPSRGEGPASAGRPFETRPPGANAPRPAASGPEPRSPRSSCAARSASARSFVRDARNHETLFPTAERGIRTSRKYSRLLDASVSSDGQPHPSHERFISTYLMFSTAPAHRLHDARPSRRKGGGVVAAPEPCRRLAGFHTPGTPCGGEHEDSRRRAHGVWAYTAGLFELMGLGLFSNTRRNGSTSLRRPVPKCKTPKCALLTRLSGTISSEWIIDVQKYRLLASNAMIHYHISCLTSVLLAYLSVCLRIVSLRLSLMMFGYLFGVYITCPSPVD